MTPNFANWRLVRLCMKSSDRCFVLIGGDVIVGETFWPGLCRRPSNHQSKQFDFFTGRRRRDLRTQSTSMVNIGGGFFGVTGLNISNPLHYCLLVFAYRLV